MLRADESYEVEVEIYGTKLKVSCPHTCARFCGRACKLDKNHQEWCDCGTNCASEIGPFDHLAALVAKQSPGVIPVQLLEEADTEEDPFFLSEEPTK